MKDAINVFYGMILSPVLTLLMPLHDFMKFAILLFIADFMFGWFAAVLNKEGWNTKKALTFLRNCFLFFGFITFVFVAAHFQHYSEANTLFIIRSVGNAAMYIFVVNILKNICKMVDAKSPWGKLFGWLYYFFSGMFLSKVPKLKEYYESKKEGGDYDDKRESDSGNKEV